MSFDVIIVGAGPTGITASIFIAKAGHKVLLIDKNEEQLIGSGIGGGVVKLEAFSGTGIARSTGAELVAFLDTFNIYSPSGKNKKSVNHTAIIVDKHLMLQRLLGYAKDSGVQVKDKTEFKSLNIENDYVTGITTYLDESISAKVVIDASGISGALKEHLPETFKIEKAMNPRSIARAYVELLEKQENSTQLSSYLAVSDGYVWRTPTEVGYGSFDPSIDLKAKLHEYINNIMKVKTDPHKSTYGRISVRQNIYNMVANGFVTLGDAACMVSPIEGAGIATGMVGAKVAAQVINEALEKNDVSQKNLWKFNTIYNKSHGAKYAYMDMLRRGITGLSGDDIDFAFEKDIIVNKDVLDSLTGDIANVSSLDKVQRAFRGIRRPGILLRMETCMSRSKELKEHYMNYPEDLAHLDTWVNKLDQINNSFT